MLFATQEIAGDTLKDRGPNRNKIIREIIVRIMKRRMVFARPQTQHRGFGPPAKNTKIFRGAHWQAQITVRHINRIDGPILRLEHGNWANLETNFITQPTQPATELDPLFWQPAPSASPLAATLSPSDLGGSKALPGEQGLDEDAAMRRGRQIHRLLEFLPQVHRDQWPDIAARLLSNGDDTATGQELALLLAESEKVLTKPTLKPLFAPDALSEVSVTANLEALGGQRIHGTIDRLLIDNSRVLAVDFKTNAIVPDTPTGCPDGLLRQLGAYAHALQAIYPDHKIETALLWTRTATLMPLPHDLVTDALITTQIS